MERRQFLKLSVTTLAVTALSIQQLDWLLGAASGPENIGTTEFQKYIVTEINKMPERQVGRIVKIETIYQETSFGHLMRGLNVSKYHKNAKYWNFMFDHEKFKKYGVRKSFVKDMANQLNVAFNQ